MNFVFLPISFTFLAGLATFFWKLWKKPFFFKFSFSSIFRFSTPPVVRQERTPEEKEQDLQIERERSTLQKAYQDALQELGIGTLTITTHNFISLATKSGSNNTNKIKRLTTEIKQISTFLPIYYSNAIFIRYDEAKMDLMKAIIMGAEDTPYSHGAFIYDIYFDDLYPNSPPKVNLMTTGGNRLRFNPNLYNNGYVCLSLLGTWSGGKNENWTNKSNLLQVLISIQSLVMTDGVLYNEPSYVMYRHQSNNLSSSSVNIYKKQNVGYSNIVRYGNVKYAMNEMIKNPPPGFEEIIKRHFFYKKGEILRTCNKWIEEAKDHKDLADYSGLVQSHNYELANRFAKNKDAYHTELCKEVENLRVSLDHLTM